MTGNKTFEEIDLGDAIYRGETVNGVMHGQGTAVWQSGDTYTGEWRNDCFHGKGTYTWADGDQYDGEYQDERQHGQGTLRDRTGVYSGNWAHDKRDGYGKQVYANGDVYEGEWLDDKKHGKGKQTYNTGAVYEGEWFRDMHHGVGVTRNSGGDVYEGEFLHNKPNGKGTYRWADGATYVGYFKDGLKHGEGCERLANGTWVAGNWIEGEHDRKQPVHKVDPNQLRAQQELLDETLSRLTAVNLQPLSLDRLRSATGGVDGGSLKPNSSMMSVSTAAATMNNNNTSGSTLKTPTPETRATTPTAAGGQLAVHPSTMYTPADFEGWQPMKMLGKGSFGAVYEAGLRSGKIVCVKIVELGSISEVEGELAKLQNEIQLMQRLNHPNIVQYYGCTEDKSSNTINIFMEYVTGGTLNHYIKKFKVIPRETVRQWAYQLVNGLKYLHDCGIVHRDIKGDNVLVTMDGVLKLADFGCSKAIDDVCSKTHGCKTMVGTPYWMAPEVIKCEGYGFKSDIWSVGCTVVEMLTGKPPWPECNSMWAAVYKIAHSAGLPTEIPKDLPPEMMDFLERCFERDPNKRASADDLLNHPYLQF